jgi:glycosyltransferase involved in cell wall biosynthesis
LTNQNKFKIDLSFIIIAKNEEQNIKKCIDSINNSMESNQIAYEIILVDSNSIDRTVEFAKNTKNTKVIQISKSTFYSAALSRNIGSNYSKGKYICFLDGDMVLKNTFIESAMELIIQDNNVVGCIGKRRDLYIDLKGNIGLIVENVYKTDKKKIAEHFGGSLLIEKRAFIDAGKFTSHLVASEEPELYLRLKKQNYLIAELPIEMIDHNIIETKRSTLFNYFFNRRSMGIGQVVRAVIESNTFKEVLDHKPLRTFIFPIIIDIIYLMVFPIFMSLDVKILLLTLILSQLFNLILSGGVKRYITNKLLIPGSIVGLFYYPNIDYELNEY